MMMERMTATMAPGTLGTKRLQPRMIASVPSANAKVGQLRSGIDVIIVHCCSIQVPDPFGTPSMSGICPEKTCTPTPVRKPTSTEALRKSPRNPSRNTRAMMSSPPHMSAMTLQ
jgi:hypothetical protein